MNYLAVGAQLPISVKLSDESTTRTITAQVLSSAGAVLFDNITLTHLANGFYMNSGYSMPDVEQVVILYRVLQGATLLISAQETLYRQPELTPVQTISAALESLELSAAVMVPELYATIIEGN